MVDSESLSAENFIFLLPRLEDTFIAYGDAGRELITGEKSAIVAPSEFDRQYLGSDGDMTALGLVRYTEALKIYNARIVKYGADKLLLLSYLLLRLSPASVATLETVCGPAGFKALKNSVDVFGLWQLINKSLFHGFSGRMKQSHLSSLLQFKQGSSNHASFLQDFKARCALVQTSFASADLAHIGYFLADDVFKALYLNAIDAAYFASPLDSYYADLVSGGPVKTLQQLTQLMQGYSLERGVTEPLSPGYVPAALVAPAKPSSVLKGSGSSSPPVLVGPRLPNDCPWCFDKGYRNKIGGRCGYTGVKGDNSCAYYRVSASYVSSAPAVVVGLAASVSALASPSNPDVIVKNYEAAFPAYEAAMAAIALRDGTG